ncbi:death-associated protein kinase related-like [Anopheles ziemanni]|uniref:death-associated protein kinase related-like n=1 Tax=Anopheles coustani TaxID=139045 RepID=UPI002658E863|nr:death-associated protein kinase related-like [Anopheles coustani]XP_058176185.1 death-associated protein kinase related-like [Anopheles ziemanni]
MSQLPEGFFHVGDGRLSASEELLQRLKTSKEIKDVYEVEESWIAKGMYGIVRSAVSKQSGVSYAAKFLRRRRRGQCCLNEINHEIAVLMLCADSNHVVKLQAVHETRAEIALILELATGGELQTLIDDHGHLSEQKTRVCMREILRALQHMHNKSIAHLDLKPQNILLAGKDVDDGLKLCDFGIARFIGDKNKIYEIIGTPDYVAPEVLHYDPLSLQTDIWSIGVVAYVLLTGLSPFGGESKQETFLNVTKCSLTFPDDLFTGISSDAIDFIKSTLRIKPRERLTVDECLAHRWLHEDAVNLSEEMLAAQLLHAVSSDQNGAQQGCLAGAEDAEKGHNVSSNDCNSIGCHKPTSLKLDEKVCHEGTRLPNCTTTDAVEEQSSERCRRGSSDAEEYKLRKGSVLEDGTEQEIKPTVEVVSLGGNTCKEGSSEVMVASDDNKENVMVVGNGSSSASPNGTTCSLFPDAPTTPKVSRKAMPTEQLSEHHSHHHSGSGHHYAHHIHHHHHHLHHIHSSTINHSAILHHHQPHTPSNLNGYSNQHSNSIYVGMSSNPSQVNGILSTTIGTGSAGRNNSSNGCTGNSSIVRHNAPSSVKSFLHMFQSHQQQQQPSAVNATIATSSAIASMIASTTAHGATNAIQGEIQCTASATVVKASVSQITERLEPTTETTRSASGEMSAPSCRTTVTAAALCGLKCNETTTVGSMAGTGSLTSAGRKTLQQCDKDVIIC